MMMRRRTNVRELAEERDRKFRAELFKKSLAITTAAAAKRAQRSDRKAEALRNQAEKTTEMLNSLVLRMSEQVKFSESTTVTLVHSSAMLKESHSNFHSVSATIRSGGKLISKYARRETTDKILIVLALILYFGVIFYILRKRLPMFDWIGLWPLF